MFTLARSSGADGSTKALPPTSRRARSIGSALNAAKFVAFEFPASLAPSALLVSAVSAGVGNAALESRRDRRAVAVAVGVRKSDDCRYFVADIVDVDDDECGGGDIVFGAATVVELVYIVCLRYAGKGKRGERDRPRWWDMVAAPRLELARMVWGNTGSAGRGRGG